MTLSNNLTGHLSSRSSVLDERSSKWDTLYCSHLWSNSELRRAIITAPLTNNELIKHCYTCRGKVRKYEIKTRENIFTPHNHSTPKGHSSLNPLGLTNIADYTSFEDQICHDNVSHKKDSLEQIARPNTDSIQCIPSISHQIDSNFSQRFSSTASNTPSEENRQRLTKSLNGIGCVVNFTLTESPIKKRTQIQACSISIMIVAIVVISLIMVNFTTPNFRRANNITSTIVVPTKKNVFNETSSAIINIYTDLPPLSHFNITEYTTTGDPFITTTKQSSLLSNIIAKIRKNIKTYPRGTNKDQNSQKPKDIMNRDVSQRFCSCQRNQVCMLDENSGTSICRNATDIDDPTGCGGLCALETEACQLVDKKRGVRVCRLLSLVTCSPQEWRCRNGLCVPADARCDGTIQCYDRSDEMQCDCDLSRQFRCGHSISCFTKKKLCDGIIDCWDGYDELNCTKECPEDQFTCTDGQCILSSRFCDGLVDCMDGSDEPQGCDGDCGTHEIRCKNRRCVSKVSQCDGHDDCGDKSDELYCS